MLSRSNSRSICSHFSRSAFVAAAVAFSAAMVQPVLASAPEPARGSDEQIMQVENSPVQIKLWQGVNALGEEAPMYAIALDGVNFSEPRHTSYQLKLRYGDFDPLGAEAARPITPGLEAGDDTNLFLVQFVTQPLEAYRQAIRDRGGVIHTFIANHAHIVRMDAKARAAVEQLPFVRWIGPYHPAYRLEESLIESVETGIWPAASARYNIMVFESGANQKLAVADRIAQLGGTVVRANAGKFLLEAILTPNQLLNVVRWDELQFIDRWTLFEKDMDIARQIGGANYVESVAGFTGQGVRGEVLDAGFNLTHVDFASRPLILHTSVDTDSHGAATSGIVFGDGTGNPIGRGMLPSAQGIVADWDSASVGPPRYAHTGQLVQSPYFAVFQTASVGSERTTQYTTISADTDAMLFDFDIVHCQSQSNAASQDSRPQAWAKNIISVGGIRHQNTLSKADDCWGCGSGGGSIGPAADGRIKPDLSHFYDNIYTTTTGSPTAYTSSFGGTSGATPIVAGHVGIFFQMWSEGVFNNPVNQAATVFENRCHMTTAKAMLINTASQYPFVGGSHDLTRVHQGWGFPDLKTLYDLRQQMFIIDETELLGNLQAASYVVEVDPGEPALRATMTYADPPGSPGASQHRINDLTLRVTSPSGIIYWGNNGLLTGNWSTPGGTANVIDTVENVFVQNPEAGEWLVEVIASEINEDGHVETQALDADFALVVSGVEQIIPAFIVRLTGALPQLQSPGEPTEVNVEIIEGKETVVPGSEMLFYRLSAGGSFVAVPLMSVGGNNYVGEIPGADCDDQPEFYVSAEGSAGTIITNPSNAPATVYNFDIGDILVAIDDDLETDAGWTVVNENLADGPWQRGVPAGGGDRGDPATDYDGSGQCFVTDNADGDSDVDGGPTRLISPVYDLTTLPEPYISYARWFYNDDQDGDSLLVEISNNGGANWVQLENVLHNPGWQVANFRVADFVTPTSAVRLRFSATDNPNNSVTEAGIDAIRAWSFICEDVNIPGDVDHDGDIDFDDLTLLLASWGDCPDPPAMCPADVDEDGDIDFDDLTSLLAAWTG